MADIPQLSAQSSKQIKLENGSISEKAPVRFTLDGADYTVTPTDPKSRKPYGTFNVNVYEDGLTGQVTQKKEFAYVNVTIDRGLFGKKEEFSGILGKDGKLYKRTSGPASSLKDGINIPGGNFGSEEDFVLMGQVPDGEVSEVTDYADSVTLTREVVKSKADTLTKDQKDKEKATAEAVGRAKKQSGGIIMDLLANFFSLFMRG